MKKPTALILTVLLMLSLLVACVGIPDNTLSVPSTSAPDESLLINDLVYAFPHEGESYFGSSPIRILCSSTSRYGEQQFSYIAETESNLVNEAVQKRNEYLEQTYGITFEIYPVSRPSEEIDSVYKSATDKYDIVCANAYDLIPAIDKDQLMQVDDHINLSNPWWDAYNIENLSLSSKYYLLVSDALIENNDHIYLTLFNKELYSSKLEDKYGDIYQLVTDGEFTIDVYTKMCKDITSDTESELYGAMGYYYTPSYMMNGFGIASASKNDDGDLQFNITFQNTVNAFEQVRGLISSPDFIELWSEFDHPMYVDDGPYMFAEGNFLFYTADMTAADRLNSFPDFEYGILPLPKLNKDQSNYFGAADPSNSAVLAVFASVEDERMPLVACALDALAYYSGDIISAYYYDTLGIDSSSPYSKDTEMLDIVCRTKFCDIGYIWLGVQNVYEKAAEDNADNALEIAWESIKNSAEIKLNALLKRY